jgi:putative solute:sodium symporter small subunit
MMRWTVAIWIAFVLCVPLAAIPLNQVGIPWFDLPLGFLMATQGALIACAVITHVFVRRQDRIDRDHFHTGDP